MITFPSILGANGLPFVMQTLTHPAVYLDTWALRLFAEGDHTLPDIGRNRARSGHRVLTFSSPESGHSGRFIQTGRALVFSAAAGTRLLPA
jgi:hypothetical protein